MTSNKDSGSRLEGRRGSARRALAPLGSTAALSWLVAVVYLPIGILVQSPGNASIFGGPLGLWVLASVIGMFPLSVILAAVRVWVSERGHPSPWLVLGTYGAAAIGQAITFGFASVLLGVADSPQLAFRISGVLFQVPLLMGVGYAVARYDAHRTVIVNLEQTRARLLETGEDLDAEVDRAEARLTSAVRQTLKPALASLEGALLTAEAGGDKSKAIETVDSLVEERIRPLAEDLTSQENLLDGIGRVDTARPRVPLPARFRLGEAIKPLLTTFLLAVVAIPAGARVLAPASLIVYIAAFCLFVWAFLAIASRTFDSVRAPTIVGVPAIVALYAAVGLASYWLIGALGVIRPEGLEGSAVAIFASAGSVFTAYLLVEARRTLSEGELEAETIQLQASVRLIRRRERLVNRRLAFIVHGALQGVLNAAALKIAEANRLTQELGDEIRNDVRNALSQLDAGSDPSPGRESKTKLRTSVTIEEIESLWSGRRGFGARLSPSVEAVLSSAPDADEAVAEVIREAVNNAFRHGAANRVQVVVQEAAGDSQAGSGELEVSVADDGTGLTGSDQPGVGSSLFDDLCETWSLVNEGARTIFRASIAVGLRRASDARPATTAA